MYSEGLITAQTADGYWAEEGYQGLKQFVPSGAIEDPEVFAELNKIKFTIPAGINQKNIYLTLLALLIIKNCYAERAQEFALMKRKAVTWLQSIGLVDPDRMLRHFTTVKVVRKPSREITEQEAKDYLKN